MLLQFVMGELFDLGHELFGDVGDALGFHFDAETPTPFSGRVLAASMVGFAAAGLIATSGGMSAGPSVGVAMGGFLLVGAGTFLGIVKVMYSQQHSASISRDSYIGLPANVTIAIPPGDFGQVSLVDGNRTRVSQKAWSRDNTTISVGTTVTVVEVTPTGVIVKAE